MQCAQLAKDLYQYGFQFAFWVNWSVGREMFWNHYKDGVYIRFVSGLELDQVKRIVAEAPDSTLPSLESYTFTFWKITSLEDAARRNMLWIKGGAYTVT